MNSLVWSIAFIAVVVVAILVVLIPVFGPRRALQGGTRSEIDRLFEEKARVLRALKDLDHEREAGTLSEADWRSARALYLEDAVRLNRMISEITGVAPSSAEAER